MALIFAQKLNYEVDANQELLAMVSHVKQQQLVQTWKQISGP